MFGASAGNGLGDMTEQRWYWLFGVHPIQDRSD
jgi:hypothetical protein